jgi:hypothetical protein
MIRVTFRFLILVVFASVAIGSEPKHAVRDQAAAIKIAVAGWEPIYGAAHIAAEKPYHATLYRGIWTVTGTLPKGMKGGVALAEISEDNGRIIRITHGK